MQKLENNITFCILVCEKIEVTLACLKSILTSRCEINLLNNNSSQYTTSLLKEFISKYKQITYFEVGKNLGVAKGRNYLIKKTKSDWIFFLDNDIIIQTPNWLEILEEKISNNPTINIFIPMIFDNQVEQFEQKRRLEVYGKKIYNLVSDSVFTNWFPGGGAIVNKSIFHDHGEFDDKIFVGFEDFEFAMRAMVNKNPLKAMYIEEITLIHDHNYSKKSVDKSYAGVRYSILSHIKSSRRIKKKHGLIYDGYLKWVIAKRIHFSNIFLEKFLRRINRIFFAKRKLNLLKLLSTQKSKNVNENSFFS